MAYSSSMKGSTTAILAPDYLDRIAKRSTERRLINRLKALGYKGALSQM